MSDPARVPNPAPLVLVLGMHRSGTSAVTGLLALAGLTAGDQLVGAHRDNPRGYFEHSGVVAVHDALFAALGRRWDDPRALPHAWLDGAAAARAEGELVALVEALRALGGVPLIKDPRACRFVPLWRRVATRCGLDLRVVLVVRDPREVQASLGVRDQLPGPRAAQLWLAHVLEAATSTRGLRRAVVRYEAALAAPSDAIADVAKRLELPLHCDTDAIRAFIDAGLRHHDANAVEAPIDPLAAEVQRTLSASPIDETAIDQLSARFERERSLYAAGLEERWRGEHEGSSVVGASPIAPANEASQRAIVATLAALGTGAATGDTPDPRLYLAGADAAFREEESLVAALEPVDRGFRARFDLPPGRDADWIRFDPAHSPGFYILERLRVGDVDVAIGARARVAGGYAVSVRDGVGLVEPSHDPHWCIDLRGLGASGARIELWFRVESLAALLDALALPRRMAALETAVAATVEHAHGIHASLLHIHGETSHRLVDAERRAIQAEQQLGRAIGLAERVLAAIAEVDARASAAAAAADASMASRIEAIERQLGGLAGKVSASSEAVERLERRSTIAHEWRRLRAFILGAFRSRGA